MPQERFSNQPSRRETTLLHLFVRLYWFLFGYFFTLYSINQILLYKAQFFSPGDILYWLSIFIIIVVRFIDVKFLHGDTAEGTPATIKDFNIYSMILLLASLFVWLGIHFFFEAMK